MLIDWIERLRVVLTRRWFKSEEFGITSHWELDVPEPQIRFILTDPMSILHWWPAVFLHGDVLQNPKGGLIGFSARFHTKGFLPHTFQFVATVIEHASNRIVIETRGDFNGIGTIRIIERGQQSLVVVDWRVSVDHPYMQPFMRVLKPVFVWNHLWAMRQGRAGLEILLSDKTRKRQLVQRPTFPHNFVALRIPSQWRI
jgi:hypothetical protein